MSCIDTEANHNLLLSIYNASSFVLILRHFRDTNPRSTYICYDYKRELLHALVYGASDRALCHILGGVFPLHTLLRDAGLAASSNYDLDNSESQSFKPEARTYMMALGSPEKWHRVLTRGWGSFLAQYLMSRMDPRYVHSEDELLQKHGAELASLTTKLLFLCKGTYTAVDLYRGRPFGVFVQETTDLLATLQCPKGSCGALKWQELVGRKNRCDFPAGMVKSMDGEDAVTWANSAMFTVRSLLDPAFWERIDLYPGLVPHLEKDFDPRVVMPSAAKKYAWRPQRLVHLLIKDAAEAFDAAREKSYFDALMMEGKERWQLAKDLKEDEEKEDYYA